MTGPAPTARPRRVLLVCDFHLKYASGLARGLADAGCPVVLLTRDHDLEFGGEPGAMRAFVAATTGGRVQHRILPGRVRDPGGLRALGRLRRSLARFAPEVVHVQEAVTNDPRLLLAAAARPRRYALTVHDPTPHPGDLVSGARRLGAGRLMRSAGLVFAHSERLRAEVRTLAGPRVPVEVVPHGMAPPRPAPLPARPALLFFGRISTYYKGLDVLLDAMPLVWRRLPETTLTIAGAGEVAPHPSLADPRVTLRNAHVPDAELPRLFADATCCVLPYREASQSGVGSQAKTFGRAIVATDVGGLPDLVGPGSGRLVPPGDAPALAEALIEVAGTPDLAEAMSRAAVEWAAEAGWDRVAARTLAAYERHLLA